MTREEFEKERRRFGDDFGAWPAPYRQQALDFLADAGKAAAGEDDDRALDRIVLEAALTETDDQALTQKVLARIEAESRGPMLSLWSWLSPAAMAAGIAAVLAAATAAGYSLAPEDGSFDSDLLAFAVGAPELGGDSDELPEDPAKQEGSL